VTVLPPLKLPFSQVIMIWVAVETSKSFNRLIGASDTVTIVAPLPEVETPEDPYALWA
jgi:hypothetical protein